MSEEAVDVLAVMRHAVSVLHGAADDGEMDRRYAEDLHKAYVVVVDLLAASREALNYVATVAVGCHGEKCREAWCYSCWGEEEADAAAERARAVYAAAHAAIAKATRIKD